MKQRQRKMDLRHRLNSSSIGSHRQNNWSIDRRANCGHGQPRCVRRPPLHFYLAIRAHTSQMETSRLELTTGYGLAGKCIRIASWNINHVSNKMHKLKGVLQVDPRPIDVLGISETFFVSNDLDVRIQIDGYHQPERRDRSGKRGGGGGLLAYVSTALNYLCRRYLECDAL